MITNERRLSASAHEEWGLHDSKQARCSLRKFFYCLLQFGVWSRRAEKLISRIQSDIPYINLWATLSVRCQTQRQPNQFHFCYTAFENTVSLSKASIRSTREGKRVSKVWEHCNEDRMAMKSSLPMFTVCKVLRSVTEKWLSLIALFWNGIILTLQIHFFSFCEHLVAPAASCTARVIMLVTCLNKNKKGKWRINALHRFLSTH